MKQTGYTEEGLKKIKKRCGAKLYRKALKGKLGLRYS